MPAYTLTLTLNGTLKRVIGVFSIPACWLKYIITNVLYRTLLMLVLIVIDL